jgi:hypothetical protein
MKRDIQIFDSRCGDRAIGILCENDVIVNITFMQGDFDEYTTKSVVEKLMGEKPDVHLLEIYKRLTLQYTELSMEEALERACELYVVAFILQELD